MKRNNTGTNILMTAVITLVIVFLIYGMITGFKFGSLSVNPTAPSVNYDGEFRDSALPGEVGGTDLVINTSYAEASEAFTVDYETDTDLNGTDGSEYLLAYGLKVSGDMEDFKVDGAFTSTITNDELRIKKAYIVPDEKGMNLNDDDALSQFVTDLDVDQNQFTIKGDTIADGDYIVVVEMRVIDGSGIADGESIITTDIDGDSDDNNAVDSGVVTIRNKI